MADDTPPPDILPPDPPPDTPPKPIINPPGSGIDPATGCPYGWEGAIGPGGIPCKPAVTPPSPPVGSDCPQIPIPNPGDWTKCLKYCGQTVNNTYNYLVGAIIDSFNESTTDITDTQSTIVNNIITEINDTINLLNDTYNFITNNITTLTDYVTETINYLQYEINNITGGNVTINNPPPYPPPPPPAPYIGPPTTVPPTVPPPTPTPPPPTPPPPSDECPHKVYETNFEWFMTCDADDDITELLTGLGFEMDANSNRESVLANFATHFPADAAWAKRAAAITSQIRPKL